MIKKISKKSKQKNTILYPNLSKLKIKVHRHPMAHVFVDDVDEALEKNKLSQETFDKLFSVQTCPVIGNGKKLALYAWDTESVLERMINKKLTGTQLFFD